MPLSKAYINIAFVLLTRARIALQPTHSWGTLYLSRSRSETRYRGLSSPVFTSDRRYARRRCRKLTRSARARLKVEVTGTRPGHRCSTDLAEVAIRVYPKQVFSSERRNDDDVNEVRGHDYRKVTVRGIQGNGEKCQPRKLRRDRRDLGSFSITVHPRARSECEYAIRVTYNRERASRTHPQRGETSSWRDPHLTRLVIASC